MHIKKLEIAGFKSFVDRTVIQFDHDVVGIVGPNGCGKSNIVDAIRWCLGEQSAKHLRGKAMEDVIFNGSESRGPHGLAEVTITFDNTNPEYAASLAPEYRDYPEIAITRRLFRDGTSEYCINKTQVRLRDVTEHFLGTGVGTKAYSIVEQGRIGQIVSARPEDRRLFIDEAAGITKYKQRRKMAERKMDLTRQNLLRVTDIVTEIDRNRASLKRQVAKAERFLDYRRELEDLVLLEASHKYLELIVTERVADEGHTTARDALTLARTELRDAEAILDAARAEASGIEASTEEASRRAFEADNLVSSLQAELEKGKERLTFLDHRLMGGNLELDSILGKVRQLHGESAQVASRVEELGSDERAREADALAETESLAALQAEEAKATGEVAELRKGTGELGARAAAEGARLDGMVQRRDEARTRRDRSITEQEKLAGERADAAARRQALERSVAELAEGKRLSVSDLEALEIENESLRSRQLDSERAVDASKNELSLKRNRLRALEDLQRRFEGVGAGARALLSKGDPRVLGLVADRIEAPAELTSALAGLLGSRLSCVVVSDRASGLELLDELRKGERGRAEILPARPGYVAGGSRHAALSEPGVLGLLVDRLAFSEADDALVRSLVGDALLVESAEAAARLAERVPGVTAVALDGTVLHPDGVVSGGSGDDVASAMIEHKREMHELVDQVARLETEAARLLADHTALRTRLTEVGTALERARKFAHEGELAHVTAEKDLARTQGDLERIEARLNAVSAELAEVDRVLAEGDEAETQCRAGLDALRSELAHATLTLGKVEETAASWRERVAAQSTLVTERRVRLAQVREQSGAAKREAERIQTSLTELEARRVVLEQELTDAAQAYGETAGFLVTTKERRGEAEQSARSEHETLTAARTRLEETRLSLTAKEAELRVLRDGLEQHDAVCKEHEMTLQRIGIERQHLLGSIKERFRGLDLRRVIGDYHARPTPDDEQRRRVEELTQLIDRMGPVNLDARSEHETAEKRFHELNDQKVDIEKALAELDTAIRHMNKESRRRFRETFDSVNELFKKTFSRMFRGGRAELVLTEGEDLLGSGVEIVAQPPGKKLGNIELMSGGEKALTAVSLIFAIFQHRPSPFCILDEVDAPLDEANVARYNEMIRQLTAVSQFVLITHIKKTMQSTDVLYGVTMGEPGVSRIVSVKVNENAVSRSDQLAQSGRDAQPVSTGVQVA
jgi:chromosome segregation protein